MRRLYLSMIIVLLLAFNACHKKIDLSLNGNTEKQIEFSCGDVKLKAYTVTRSNFAINQYFNLTEQSVIYKDSLSIKYKGNFLEYYLSHNSREVKSSSVNVTNDDVFGISFSVHDPLPNPGDTVIVQDKGYLYCNGNHVDFGEILLIVK